MGKCYVQHQSAISDLKSWLCHGDCFYVPDYLTKPSFVRAAAFDQPQVMDLSTHSYCEECYEEHIRTLAKQDLAYARNKPLKALELFSGSFFTFFIIIELTNML